MTDNDDADFASAEEDEHFRANTETMRAWLSGDTVLGGDLVKELDYWLKYWGGSSDELKTDDAAEFGHDVIVYCRSHMRPHFTGWCTVPIDQKTKLDAETVPIAYEECEEKGFPIYRNDVGGALIREVSNDG